MNIGIYIYPEAEVLDFSGPYEVFSTAARIYGLDWQVGLIAGGSEAVQARGGYMVLPHWTRVNHPDLDILMISGGVHTLEMENAETLAWLTRQRQAGVYTAAVCTGAFLLASSGLEPGTAVTTHHEDMADLAARYPSLEVMQGRRYIIGSEYATSGGISAGIDLALALVDRYAGVGAGARTAMQMEYPYDPNRT